MESRWPFGSYPPGGLERLGPHVVAFYAPTYPLSNSAIVRGSEATLVFDANLLSSARALRAAVDDDSGPPLRDLVLSHAHNDHVHGAMHFSPPAEVWSTGFVRDRLEYWAARDLEPFIEEQAAQDPSAAAEYRDVRIVVPGRVVDDEGATLELGGGVRVHLRTEARAHTPADLWAFVEPDGIALCGDLWFNGCEPYLGNGSLAGTHRALRDLRDAGARLALPGHGAAGPLPGPDDDSMERYARWLEVRVAEAMAAGARGDELRARVRRAWEEQRAGPRPIAFAQELPGFLEDGVEMAEAEVEAATS